IEVKAQKGYDTEEALGELRVAKENREAQIGIFVFARRAAPMGLEPFSRFGSDIVVVWDEDDPMSDVFLKAAYTVARALVIARKRDAATSAVDFAAIDGALLDIKRHTEALDEIRTWAQTVKSAGQKIEERIRVARTALLAQIEDLQNRL